MDILWLAVRITIRLMVAVVKGAMWMGTHGTPQARKAGQSFASSVNMSWYPFPFGNLAFEMVVIWALLAILLGGIMARSPVGGLFVGLLVLPLFYGFGQGMQKPVVSGDRPLIIEGKPTLDGPVMPIIDQMSPVTPQGEELDEASVRSPASVQPIYQSLSPTTAHSNPEQFAVRTIDDSWQLLMEAPEVIVHGVMSLGRMGPVQFLKETAASARALASAQMYPDNELIQSASKWADFTSVRATEPQDLAALAVSHCREVRAALEQGYDRREGTEFCGWLLHLAYEVAAAAAETEGSSPISAAEERLLTELAEALAVTYPSSS